jgi:hypothetical protein
MRAGVLPVGALGLVLFPIARSIEFAALLWGHRSADSATTPATRGVLSAWAEGDSPILLRRLSKIGTVPDYTPSERSSLSG